LRSFADGENATQPSVHQIWQTAHSNTQIRN